MASQLWRKQLREALQRQELPRAYVDRLVEELSDHATDLSLEDASMEAQQNVEARLGTPEQLASAAKSEFQRRTFAGRYPVVTFLAGPIVAMMASILASVLFVILGCWLIDVTTGGTLTANDETNAPPSAWEVGVMQVFNSVVRFAPFAFSAWLFTDLGRRSGRRGWSVAACGIVAATAVLFSSVVTQATAQSRGLWMMGFGWKFGLDQILQSAAPLALGAWMLRQPTGRPKTVSA